MDSQSLRSGLRHLFQHEPTIRQDPNVFSGHASSLPRAHYPFLHFLLRYVPLPTPTLPDVVG